MKSSKEDATKDTGGKKFVSKNSDSEVSFPSLPSNPSELKDDTSSQSSQGEAKEATGANRKESLGVVTTDLIKELNASGGANPAESSGGALNPMSTRDLLQQVLASSQVLGTSLANSGDQRSAEIGQQLFKNQLSQLDCSLTNLFDSLQKPLVHENRFDLTQKINENFKDILGSINKQIAEG